MFECARVLFKDTQERRRGEKRTLWRSDHIKTGVYMARVDYFADFSRAFF
jgi:hypothetical protein